LHPFSAERQDLGGNPASLDSLTRIGFIATALIFDGAIALRDLVQRRAVS